MEPTLLMLFPAMLRAQWRYVAQRQEQINEIRLRNGKPILVYEGGREYFLDEEGEYTCEIARARNMNGEEIAAILEHACDYSLYAFEEELRRGFLTVEGGHRIGICGQIIPEEGGGVRAIKSVSSMNIRVSHEVWGVSDAVLPWIYHSGRLRNVLILSPPGCGKTTLLRDLIRQISDGNAWDGGRTVGVVDERCEIAAGCLGRHNNRVGMRTDVMDACPKTTGIGLLLRSMAPQVIAVDEIGSREDMDALKEAAVSGCSILATAHGADVSDIRRRFPELMKDSFFELFVVLEKRNGRCLVKSILEEGRC